MTASTVSPVKWSSIVIIIAFVGTIIEKGYCEQEPEASSFEIQSKTTDFQASEVDNEVPANRVLPVDAEHKRKISFPQTSLDPICAKALRDNLVKFLKRVERSEGYRQARARQDEDDGDDGDEGALQGVINSVAEGDGLGALSGLPAIVPSFINTLTQISGAVNQGLNGTDTPNLPSFLVRQGLEAIKLFQAVSGAASPSRTPPPSDTYTPHRIPGGGDPPMRKPRPPSYEPYPSGDPEDYIDEDVKQPLQPTLRPLRPGGGNRPQSPYEQLPGGNRPHSPYEPMYGGNPAYGFRPMPTPKPEDNGFPSGTSLWQIYKSFRTRAGGLNGSLTDFQLAHPEAFSNELLQSIAQSISSVRNPNLPPITDKPSSEIFKQFYPSTSTQTPAAAAFVNPNRPTLSVYKPGGAASALGIDLSNLALNVSLNKVAQEASNEETEQTLQQELEAVAIAGPSFGVDKDKIDGSRFTPSVSPPTAPFKNKNSVLVTTGSLSKLHAQQQQALLANGGGPAQFVKSPTSSHLTISHNGDYVAAISSLHEGDESIRVVGPQTNVEDSMNGFKNKAPYTQDKLGIFVQAPQITPAPLVAVKPPSNWVINDANPTETTRIPEFTFQNSNRKPGSSGSFSLYPPASNRRPFDPNAPRPSAVIASIPSQFQLNQNPLHTSGVLPPSLIPQKLDNIPENIATEASIIATEASVGTEIATETDHVISSTSQTEDIQQEVEVEPATVSPEEPLSVAENAPPPTTEPLPDQPQIVDEGNEQDANGNSLDEILTSTFANIVEEVLPPEENGNNLAETETSAPAQVIIVDMDVDVTTETSTTSELTSENNAAEKPFKNTLLSSFLSSSAYQFKPQQVLPSLANVNLEEPQSVGGDVLASSENQVEPQVSPNNTDQVESHISPTFINSAHHQIPASLDSDHQLTPQITSSLNNGPMSIRLKQKTPHDKVVQALLSSFNFPNFIKPEGESQELSESVTDSELISTFAPETETEVHTQAQEDIVSSTISSLFVEETANTEPNLSSLLKGTFPFSNVPEFAQHKNPEPPTVDTEDSTFSATLIGEKRGSTEPTQQIIQFPNFSQHLANNHFPSVGNLVSATELDVMVESSTTSTSSPVQTSEISNSFFVEPLPFPVFASGNNIIRPVISNVKESHHPPGIQTWSHVSGPEVYETSEVSVSPILNNSATQPPDFVKFSFSDAYGYYPDHNNNLQGILGSIFANRSQEAFPINNIVQTTLPSTSKSPNEDLPALSQLNYENFNQVPSSSSGRPTSGYSPQVYQGNPSQPDLTIISSSQFQGPVQNTGYPAFVPKAPPHGDLSSFSYQSSTIQTSSPSSHNSNPYGSGNLPIFAQSNINVPNFGIPLPQDNMVQIPSTGSGSISQPQFEDFDKKPSNSHITSAIAEMSKLPFFQPELFRPSVLPPLLSSGSEKEEDDYEQLAEVSSIKPIAELFSAASNVSHEDTSTNAPSYPTEQFVVQEDSEEQVNPNLSPAKPVYWMNMYYPGGIPVLTKVKTTTEATTTMRPRRRRTRSTTVAPTTTTTVQPVTEPEYYDDDDVGPQKSKKKKIYADFL